MKKIQEEEKKKGILNLNSRLGTNYTKAK